MPRRFTLFPQGPVHPLEPLGTPAALHPVMRPSFIVISCSYEFLVTLPSYSAPPWPSCSVPSPCRTSINLYPYAIDPQWNGLTGQDSKHGIRSVERKTVV